MKTYKSIQNRIYELRGNRIILDSTAKDMSSQIVMTYPVKRPISLLPYAFTEQDVAMLSGVLNSDKAIKKQLQEIKMRIKNHDENIEQLYEARN